MADDRTRGSRVTGAERAELAASLGRRYAAGESVRALAEDTGRSFGFVHGLVKEAGVPLRSRGGPTRGAAALATTSVTAASGPPDADETSVVAETPEKKRKGKAEGDKASKAKGGKASKANGGKASKAKDAKAKGKKARDRKGSGKGGR